MKDFSRILKEFIVLLSFLFACFVFIHCSYQGPSEAQLIGLEIVPQNAIAPSSTKIPLTATNTGSVNNIEVVPGTTIQFIAYALYTSGPKRDVTTVVTWNSSDQSVARIIAGPSANGGLATVSSTQIAGTTIISATLKNGINALVKSSPINITVIQKVLTSIQITPTTAFIPTLGNTQNYTAMGTYFTGNISPPVTDNITTLVTWNSDNTGIATIDAAGEATGVGDGQTHITATLDAVLSNIATLDVGAPILQFFVISPAATAIPAGLTQPYTATGTFSYGPPQIITNLVTWNSSNHSAATIESTPDPNPGLATTVTRNTTTNITATYGLIPSQNTAILNVIDPLLTSTSVTSSILPVPDISLGTDSNLITAVGHYSDGSSQTPLQSPPVVTWTSNNSICQFTNIQGQTTQVKAVGPGTGTCEIRATVTASGVTYTPITVTVTDAALVSTSITPASIPGIPSGTTSGTVITAVGHFSSGPDESPLTSRTVTWSSDSALCSFSPLTGGTTQVVAVPPGTGQCSVTATVTPSVSYTSITVDVIAPILQSITIEPSDWTMNVGAAKQFTATGNLSDGTTAPYTDLVTWTATNTPSVVIINPGPGTPPGEGPPGYAVGQDVGTSIISATFNAIPVTPANLTVTTPTVTSITLVCIPTSISYLETSACTATVFMSDSTSHDGTNEVTWLSDDPGVASIAAGPGASPPGEATGQGNGSANITAKIGDVTSNPIELTVTVPLVSIAVTPASFRFGVGGAPKQMTATGTYANGVTADITGSVTWSFVSTPVSPSTISLSGGGEVTPLASGSAVVTATLGVSGSTTVIVFGNLAFARASPLGVVRGSYLSQTGTVVIDPSDLYYLTNNTGFLTPTICSPTGLSFDNNNNLWLANQGTGCGSSQNIRTITRFLKTDLNTPGSPIPNASINNAIGSVTGVDRYGNLWVFAIVSNVANIYYYRAADLTNPNPSPYMTIRSTAILGTNARWWFAVDNTSCNPGLSVCDVWVSQASNSPIGARNILKFSTSQMGAASGTITINTPSLRINGGTTDCSLQNTGTITFDPSGNLWLGAYLVQSPCINPNLTRFAPSYLAQTGSRTPTITTNVVDNFYVSLSGDYRVGAIFLDAGGNLWIGNSANTGSVGILEFDITSIPNQSRPPVIPAVPIRIIPTLTLNSQPPNAFTLITSLALN